MLNVDFLKSGLILNTHKYNKNSSNIKDKKTEYYRLSTGFKDANNYYMNKKKSNNYIYGKKIKLY